MIDLAGMSRVLRWGSALALSLNLHPSPLAGQGGATTVRGVQMGMEVRITAHGPAGTVTTAATAALARIDSLEWIVSEWRPRSEVARLDRVPAGTWVPLSRELFEIVATALAVAHASDGAFDPTIGPLTALWREARRTGIPPGDSATSAARSRVGWHLVALDSSRRAIRFERTGMRLDLGGIAKGWLLGEARATMARAGITSVLIEAGGDIVAGAPPPGRAGWRVAVGTDGGDSVITIADAAVATSGPGAQWIVDRDGTRRSHVIDPRSDSGSAQATTITVIGRDPATTDALATALTLVEPERRAKLAARFGVQFVSRLSSIVAPPRPSRTPPPPPVRPRRRGRARSRAGRSASGTRCRR